MGPEVHAVVAVYKTEVLHPLGLVCRRRRGAAFAKMADPVCPHQERRNVVQDAANFLDVVRLFAEDRQVPVGAFEVRVFSHQVKRIRPHFQAGQTPADLAHHAAPSAANAGDVDRDGGVEVRDASLQGGVGWVRQIPEGVFRLCQQARGVVVKQHGLGRVALVLAPVHVSRKCDAERVMKRLLDLRGPARCCPCDGGEAVAMVARFV